MRRIFGRFSAPPGFTNCTRFAMHARERTSRHILLEAGSMLRQFLKKIGSGFRSQPHGKNVFRRFTPTFDSLDERLTPAVTASFSAGTLSVFGDTLDNNITLSRNAAGQILVNGGAVAIFGGTSTVANT